MTQSLADTRILISGAGVAGPALACCLQRYGAQVTVVEVSPQLRSGGFPVDFRGPTHRRVLSELGVLEALRAMRTRGSALRCVDAAEREVFCLPGEFISGELEVYRGDLSRVLYERSAQNTEYIFGEQIVALRQVPSHVEVELARGGTRQFDLVIGSDGMKSSLRRLAFGPQRAHAKHLGYQVAGWSVPNSFGATEVAEQLAEPGRMVSFSVDQRDRSRAIAFCVFASPETEIAWHDTAAQKALLKRIYAGMSWHVPTLMGGLDAAEDLYFDAISRVQLSRFSEGRVALLGDAAWGVTFGGVGPGVVGAYVLAGELAAAGGDHTRAFAAYEQRMRDYAGFQQKLGNPGAFLAPRTAQGLWLRNTLLALRPIQWLLLHSTQRFATDTELPHYPGLATCPV